MGMTAMTSFLLKMQIYLFFGKKDCLFSKLFNF